MLNCIIIEDQPPAQRILQTYIADTLTLELKGVFSEVTSAKSLIEKEAIDIIFLDIHLPKISGIDFLKSSQNHPWVILTTAFSEYALESYEYKVADYLLKPFSFERFSKATQKVNDIIDRKNIATKTITVKTGHEYIKVSYQDILYIKSDYDYTEIITASKRILTSDSLKNWIEKLDHSFCQIHKSYIINTNHIVKNTANQVELTNDIKLSIGRTFKKKFVEEYVK